MRVNSIHLSLPTAVLCALLSTGAVAQDWEVRSNEIGVKLESRAVPGERLEELRVTTQIAVAPGVIAEVLFHEFLDEVPDNVVRRFITRTQDLTVLSDRFRFTGLGDRCYTMRFERVAGPAQRDLLVRFTTEAAVGQISTPVADCVPMRSRGEWSMTATERGTQLTYVSFTDPGGQMPAFLVRRSLSSAVVKNVKRVAESATRRAVAPSGS